MILVTGASGHFGKAAIQSLLERGVAPAQVSALVRSEAAAATFKEQGVQVVIGDYDKFDSLVKAFQGVDKLLFISASEITKRMEQHSNVVNAAKQAGVKHIVYTSFQRKTDSPGSPLWIVAETHIQTEQWLKESGLAYTILLNNLYMDFLPGFIGEKVLESGVIYVPAGTGKIGAVLRSDMAEAAAAILAGSGHEGKTYEFTNTEAVSYADIAALLSAQSGKAIQFISPSPDEYRQTLSSYGVPAESIGIFSSFAIAQAEGELDKESTDLEKLLGRKPVSVKAFLQQVYS